MVKPCQTTRPFGIREVDTTHSGTQPLYAAGTDALDLVEVEITKVIQSQSVQNIHRYNKYDILSPCSCLIVSLVPIITSTPYIVLP